MKSKTRISTFGSLILLGILYVVCMNDQSVYPTRAKVQSPRAHDPNTLEEVHKNRAYVQRLIAEGGDQKMISIGEQIAAREEKNFVALHLSGPHHTPDAKLRQALTQEPALAEVVEQVFAQIEFNESQARIRVANIRRAKGVSEAQAHAIDSAQVSDALPRATDVTRSPTEVSDSCVLTTETGIAFSYGVTAENKTGYVPFCGYPISAPDGKERPLSAAIRARIKNFNAWEVARLEDTTILPDDETRAIIAKGYAEMEKANKELKKWNSG